MSFTFIPYPLAFMESAVSMCLLMIRKPEQTKYLPEESFFPREPFEVKCQRGLGLEILFSLFFIVEMKRRVIVIIIAIVGSIFPNRK